MNDLDKSIRINNKNSVIGTQEFEKRRKMHDDCQYVTNSNFDALSESNNFDYEDYYRVDVHLDHI
jgi:hypothetical protein